MADEQDTWASQSQGEGIDSSANRRQKDTQTATVHREGPPEGIDVTGTEWEPKSCVEISEIGAETFIELVDGTYHGLGPGVTKVSVEELQRQLKAKGKPALSDEKIAQLREDRLVEEKMAG